jgi:hypothetical protein
MDLKTLLIGISHHLVPYIVVLEGVALRHQNFPISSYKLAGILESWWRCFFFE